jgi:hypothetical protein
MTTMFALAHSLLGSRSSNTTTSRRARALLLTA